jgi:arylsulfatase A-like enzyme
MLGILIAVGGGAHQNGGPAQGFNGNMASNWPLRGMKRTLWEGGVRGTSFISGAGITGGRTSMELHASTDWMPSLLSVVLNGLSADPISADRVPWTAVFDEAEPPFQLGDGMDCWASLATTAPSPRKEVIHESHPHGTGTDDGNGQVRQPAQHVPLLRLLFHFDSAVVFDGSCHVNVGF